MLDMAYITLLVCFCALMVVAAVGDVRTYRIPNLLNGTIALLALPYWLVSAKGNPASLWILAKPQLLLIAVVFALMLVVIAFDWFGGGDAKLLLASAFWLSPTEFLSMITIMALAGGILSGGILIAYRVRLNRARVTPGAPAVSVTINKPRVPYGVAIAVGALTESGQRIVNALMG